jgi:type IV secretion system protein VirB8
MTRPLDSKLATMEFVYKTNLKMDDQNRIENPLGFQVTSYRVDADYDATPPGEIAGASLPSADAAGAGQTAPNAQTPQALSASADALPPASAELPPTIPPQPPIPEHVNPQAAGAAVPAPRNTANGVGHR